MMLPLLPHSIRVLGLLLLSSPAAMAQIYTLTCPASSTVGVNPQLLSACNRLQSQISEQLRTTNSAAATLGLPFPLDPSPSQSANGQSIVPVVASSTAAGTPLGGGIFGPTASSNQGFGSAATSRAVISSPSTTQAPFGASNTQAGSSPSTTSATGAGAAGSSTSNADSNTATNGAAGAAASSGSPNQAASSSGDNHHYRNTVVIPAAVVCSVVGAILIGLFLWWLLFFRKRKQDTGYDSPSSDEKALAAGAAHGGAPNEGSGNGGSHNTSEHGFSQFSSVPPSDGSVGAAGAGTGAAAGVAGGLFAGRFATGSSNNSSRAVSRGNGNGSVNHSTSLVSEKPPVLPPVVGPSTVNPPSGTAGNAQELPAGAVARNGHGNGALAAGAAAAGGLGAAAAYHQHKRSYSRNTSTPGADNALDAPESTMTDSVRTTWHSDNSTDGGSRPHSANPFFGAAGRGSLGSHSRYTATPHSSLMPAPLQPGQQGRGIPVSGSNTPTSSIGQAPSAAYPSSTAHPSILATARPGSAELDARSTPSNIGTTAPRAPTPAFTSATTGEQAERTASRGSSGILNEPEGGATDFYRAYSPRRLSTSSAELLSRAQTPGSPAGHAHSRSGSSGWVVDRPTSPPRAVSGYYPGGDEANAFDFGFKQQEQAVAVPISPTQPTLVQHSPQMSSSTQAQSQGQGQGQSENGGQAQGQRRWSIPRKAVADPNRGPPPMI